MLSTALIIAFIVQFVYACTWDGMIFHSIVERLWSLPTWVKKPIFGCPICMTPWWGALFLGILVYSTDYPVDSKEVITGIVTLFTAAGINAAFIQLFPHETEQ